MHRANVLKLYKTILRLHRALPKEMRELGDQYTKDEFRRHKTISKEFVAPFMVEWSEYAITLAKQIGLRGPKSGSDHIGKPLPEEKLEDFEGQQIYQLYELRKSIGPIPEEEQGTGGRIIDDNDVKVRTKNSTSDSTTTLLKDRKNITNNTAKQS